MNLKYYVVSARHAWDTVEIGLFRTYEEALCSAGYNPDIVREATLDEVSTYLDGLRSQQNGTTMYYGSEIQAIFG